MTEEFTKVIVYSPHDEGRKLADIIRIGRTGGGLFKTAAEREYAPEIMDFIRKLEPQKGKTYALINALGAGEYWGSNKNADFFPEDALTHDGKDYGYRTFVHYARPYKHHINKPDSPAYGDVLESVYNPRMHRVELVVGVDNNKAPDIAERIEDGDDVPVSMGCKVPYDVCSICGNKAKNVSLYCEHMRETPNQVLGCGRRVYVINLTPKFFDISFVYVGADKTARVMAKVAEDVTTIRFPSGLMAYKLGYHDKDAVIHKQIPGEAQSVDKVLEEVDKGVKELSRREVDLPLEKIKKASSYDLNGTLATLTQSGIVLKPHEFQYLALNNMGHSKQAATLVSKKEVFSETPYDENMYKQALAMFDFNIGQMLPGVAGIFSKELPERSAYQPALMQRVKLLTDSPPTPAPAPATDASLMPLLGGLAALYAAYRDKLPATNLGPLDQLIAKNPALLALLAGLVGGGITAYDRYAGGAEKLGSASLYLGIPAAAYMYSGAQQRRRFKGERLGPIDKLFADYPWIPAVGGVMIGGKLAPYLRTKLGSFVGSCNLSSLIASGDMSMIDYRTTLDLISPSYRRD